MEKPQYLEQLEFLQTHKDLLAKTKEIGEKDLYLRMLGDDLAKEHGWTQLRYLEAVHLHVLQKHDWPLSEIRSLSTEDLLFVLTDEFQWHSNQTQGSLSLCFRLGWKYLCELGS